MKKLSLIITLLALGLNGYSQSVGFSYQAVAIDRTQSDQFGRNSEGKILANQDLTVRFVISEMSASGTTVYNEDHITVTDAFGMFRLIVGRGNIGNNDEFQNLNWGEVPYFLHVEVKIDGVFECMGSEELLGSPYALNSKSQVLSIDDNVISLSSNGGEVEIPAVNFSDLENVPVGIEDGDDVLTEAEVDAYADNNGYLTSVDYSDLGNVPAELTTIITDGGVEYTDLLNVPAGIADGDDVLTEAEVDAYADNNGYLTAVDYADLGNIPAELTTIITDGGVEYSDLLNVPAGIADGDDVLTEAQVDAYANNNGYLTSVDYSDLGNVPAELTTIITDGGVEYSDLLNVPTGIADGDDVLTEAEVDAYADNNGYLTAVDYSDLGNVPTALTTIINDGGVEYTDLLNVPAGIADGDDVLTEAEVDAYADNNGYLTAVDYSDLGNVPAALTTIITDGGVEYTDILNVPAGIEDGDDVLTEAEVDAYADNNGYLTSLGNAEIDGLLTIDGDNDDTDVYTFPGNDGADGSVLTTDGPGAVSWSMPTTGSFTTTSNTTSNSEGDYATDDFLFGSPQLADDTDADHDARMFFDKSKGAFRAGTVTGDQWDDANVGDYSTVGGGWQNNASGGSSTIGDGEFNTASGFSTTVGGGWTNTAPGHFCTVGGGFKILPLDIILPSGGAV
ncbi:MAG: hypothetical protein OCD76_08880 [Reichenbachiella sp.]